ncbi:TolC family protein [Terasakiella sp.]|uniref:TolC family protein n=1 Tax=Terasakiella sp. TaxID=2034861 RepID=UPI003AFF907A
MMSLKTFLLVGGCLALSACNADLNRLMTRDAIEAPANWQEAVQIDPIDENWIDSFQSTELSSLIDRALQHNIELKKRAYDLQIKEQLLLSAQSSFFPTLDFNFSQKRSGLTEGGAATNAASIGLDLAYELDVWGKMSDSEREAKLALMSTQATFQQARQQLAADVATAWLDIIEAKKLLSLYLQRFANAQDNRIIIESGYEKGLNEALDVYLVRNELDAEQATIEQQKTVITTAIRTLERYLGEYPKGLRAINDDLPVLNSPMRTGLPKDLIERKASLNASWRDLLSANAALAYAHKARLPSLKFSADIKDSATLANKLFSGALLHGPC